MFLSVILPAYNAEGTLKPCLKAIRNSTYTDYELILVDDGSQDRTREIADPYCDRVLVHDINQGRAKARNTALPKARGEVLVFVDADVIVRPDTLNKISDYFKSHPNTGALTGLLSKEHPNTDFFSQFKNLYMNYIFRQLPEQVSFVYGSLHAILRENVLEYDPLFLLADDTDVGQRLRRQGVSIGFLKDLDVVHLKKHSFWSWLKNDFQVPYDWVHLFVCYQGWKEWGRTTTGFAHAPKEQILGLIFATGILTSMVVGGILSHPWVGWSLLGALFFWGLCKSKFLIFLTKEKGPWFGFLSIFITLLDDWVMMAGVLSGFLSLPFKPLHKALKNAKTPLTSS